VKLQIEKLIYGGDGLSRLPANEQGPGKSVFVPFVLPGENIEAEIVEEKPGFARARPLRIIEPAPNRIQPGCPYFQDCGGCHYQQACYEDQIAIKAAILRETLKRTARLDLPCELQIHRSPEWNYRNRTRMKVRHVPEFALGYYRFRSHELLAVEQCPISSPLINRTIQALWTKGREKGLPPNIQEIELFTDAEDSDVLLEIYLTSGTSRAEARQASDAVMGLLPGMRGVAAFEQPRAGSPDPKRLAQLGDDYLSYRVGEIAYRVSAGAFFQVNRFMTETLVRLVTADRSGELAYDLYAGGGLFSAVLARSFAQVIAVEASQTSYADLRHNAPPEVKAVRSTTEQFVSSAARPDFVVVDPPRGGLGEKVIRSLAGIGAPRMTYVSCDPSTLARDLKMLMNLGYGIESAHLIDFFPQTFHIESVFHLAR
jgi:23S rRNA (uracil1939-C5)-methyltransferase